MKKIFSILALCLTVTGTFSCSGQSAESSTKLDAFIKHKADSMFKTQHVPGIFIGVSNNGVNKYYNYGYAVPDTKTAFDSATIFEIGSITKTFTTYIVTSVLKEKGISDSSSIISYLPDSVKNNKALENIPFLSLMNHTSGLPRLPGNMDIVATMAPYDRYTSKELFAYLKSAIPKPNGKSNYSNLGMGLAGVLAEHITGKTYAELLDQYIFLPFKLVTPDKAIASANKSQGYMENEKADYWNMDVLAPAGGLKCSAQEMLTYLTKMGDPINEQSKNIITKLLEPTVQLNSTMNVCRGWIALEQKDKPIIYWHNGGTYGFSTFAAFTKGGKQSVIVVVNKFNANAVSDGLGMSIIKTMLP